MLFYDMGAGPPPLGHEATPNRAVLRQGLIAIFATEATLMSCRQSQRNSPVKLDVDAPG
jgi:hypothetical protein